MKIVTWNVNSIRMRLARTKALLARHQPDVLALQELKVTSEGFPESDLRALGYRSAVHGQAGRNGVGLVAPTDIGAVQRGFPGDPSPQDARVIAADITGLRVISVYVVNGRAVGTAEYEAKLRWLDAFVAWIRDVHDPALALLVVGDFNITPDDRDVHDPVLWRGRNLCSEPERDRLRALLDWGLVDLLRLHHDGPGPFTFWDYRAGAFHRGWGLRLDLALATRPLAERCVDVRVERNERKPTFGEGRPSDHAPLIITLRPPS